MKHQKKTDHNLSEDKHEELWSVPYHLHLSKEEILSPRVPLRSPPEQKLVAERTNSAVCQINAYRQEANKPRRIKVGLMCDLLSGNVRISSISTDNFEVEG